MWSKLNHPNILPLLGYSFCGDTGYPLLVSAWMDFGTAWNYINDHTELLLSDILPLVRSHCHKISCHTQQFFYQPIDMRRGCRSAVPSQERCHSF